MKHFHFRVPEGRADNVVFSHLSYDPFTVDLSGLGPKTEDLDIILNYHELPEVLLLNPGTYYFAIRFVEFEGDGALICKGYFKGASFIISFPSGLRLWRRRAADPCPLCGP